ncbi:hypothetical protein P7C73_g6101, partial [Tremellales sp. Uapishka_1]
MISLPSISLSNPLPLLPPHLPTLLSSAATFYAVQLLSRRYSPTLLGRKWHDFDRRTKNGWDSHVVSMVHALIILPWALTCLNSRVLAKDPVFGYDSNVGNLLAFTSGYFIWDTIDSSLNSTIGFVVHGAACLAVFLFSFRPFLAGFGPPFLLWELSTPFLNIHWFMDKLQLGTVYPTLQLANALAFMCVFFLARILYGGHNTILFLKAMWTERHRIPLHLQVIYCSGNLALNYLNWLWFSKMFAKMLARLSGEDKPSAGKAVPPKAVKESEQESISLPANPPSPVRTMEEKEEGQ